MGVRVRCKKKKWKVCFGLCCSSLKWIKQIKAIALNDEKGFVALYFTWVTLINGDDIVPDAFYLMLLMCQGTEYYTTQKIKWTTIWKQIRSHWGKFREKLRSWGCLPTDLNISLLKDRMSNTRDFSRQNRWKHKTVIRRSIMVSSLWTRNN